MFSQIYCLRKLSFDYTFLKGNGYYNYRGDGNGGPKKNWKIQNIPLKSIIVTPSGDC